jgi:hypothetical protein
MGCDIHSLVQTRKGPTAPWVAVKELPVPEDWAQYYGTKGHEAFYGRDYSLFAFLAGVRNYAECTPICPQKDLPRDIVDGAYIDPKYGFDYHYVIDGKPTYIGDHSYSWLTLRELLNFNYDQWFSDEREKMYRTYRDFLAGSDLWRVIDVMKGLGEPENVRVVFGFDN